MLETIAPLLAFPLLSVGSNMSNMLTQRPVIMFILPISSRTFPSCFPKHICNASLRKFRCGNGYRRISHRSIPAFLPSRRWRDAGLRLSPSFPSSSTRPHLRYPVFPYTPSRGYYRQSNLPSWYWCSVYYYISKFHRRPGLPTSPSPVGSRNNQWRFKSSFTIVSNEGSPTKEAMER